PQFSPLSLHDALPISDELPGRHKIRLKPVTPPTEPGYCSSIEGAPRQEAMPLKSRGHFQKTGALFAEPSTAYLFSYSCSSSRRAEKSRRSDCQYCDHEDEEEQGAQATQNPDDEGGKQHGVPSMGRQGQKRCHQRSGQGSQPGRQRHGHGKEDTGIHTICSRNALIDG